MKYLLPLLLIIPWFSGFAQSDTSHKTQAVDSNQVDLKNIKLKEVNIRAKKPLIEMDLDKTIVNVSGMISSASSNTMEVLEKTPGITIDAQGNISLNGRSGVMVLINGRQTYLSAADLAIYLRSVPGANLDKIELVDNPPAKYEAAGNGLINIRLKKTRIGGFTGSIGLGYVQGRLPKSNQSLNLNYNYKKINIFSNLSYSDDQNYNSDQYIRHFYNPTAGLMSKVLLNNEQQYRSRATNINLGIDYAASKLTSIALQIGTNTNKRKGLLDSYSRNYGNDQLDSTGAGHIDFGHKKNSLSGAFSILQKFGKPGRELSAEAGYMYYKNEGDASLQNDVFGLNRHLLHTDRFTYDLPSTMGIYTIKSDYLHPLKNKGIIEAGLKWSTVTDDNLSGYYQVSDRSMIIDNKRSNHFIYREDILAAYISGQKSWKYWSFKIGIRAEQTKARGEQLGNADVAGSNFTKKYTQFFPSLFVNYKLDTTATNSFSISLTRRINRPNYQQLNPFVIYTDQYSSHSGNPKLDPQYQYRYELKYHYKQFLRIGLSYNHFSDVIFETTNVTNGIFIRGPQNIAQGSMILLSTGISVDPTAWWSLNSDILLSRISLNGQAHGEDLMPKTYIARINLMNQFPLKKGWNAEVGGYYASRDLSGQTYTSGMYRLSAGLQKKIWKNKGSIRLSLDDIFHSWVYENRSISLKQATALQIRESDSQRVGIGFAYSFGNELFKRKSKLKGNALDEETSRM